MQGDTVTEGASAGTDTVNASVSFSLAGQFLENLTLTGTGNINATGNSFANVINGGAGADTMAGGAGNDTIYGGLGIDQLSGGASADNFVFNTPLDGDNNVDYISDFVVVDDTIQLSQSMFGGWLSACWELPLLQ